jgi:hypothetical protein
MSFNATTSTSTSLRFSVLRYHLSLIRPCSDSISRERERGELA